MSSTSNYREELYHRLPLLFQPFITWISGIPSEHEQVRFPMTSILVIVLGLLSIVVGFVLIQISSHLSWAAIIPCYILGMFFVAGGMRRLDVLIIHQTLHSKVLATPLRNRILGEILTTLLLRTPYIENQKEHLGHHRNPCDEDDADVVFLRAAGVTKASSRSRLYARIFAISLSPIFHARFTIGRIVGNFVTARPLHRLSMSWLYAVILAAPAVYYGASYLQGLMLFWLVPLTIGFQISNFLYTATKHRWWIFDNQTVRGKEKRDMLSYARVCCSPAPNNGTVFNWGIWWLESVFIHVPVRLFIVVGDTVQHDLHHVAPTCDWPNSAYERQSHNIKTPERFTEVWGGFFAHLNECNLESSANAYSDQIVNV